MLLLMCDDASPVFVILNVTTIGSNITAWLNGNSGDLLIHLSMYSPGKYLRVAHDFYELPNYRYSLGIIQVIMTYVLFIICNYPNG